MAVKHWDMFWVCVATLGGSCDACICDACMCDMCMLMRVQCVHKGLYCHGIYFGFGLWGDYLNNLQLHLSQDVVDLHGTARLVIIYAE